MKNLFNMKKSATKTAVQMTPAQKKTTTVANVSGKIKNAAFGVATGAGVTGSMMLQNERSIRNRKDREAYHKRVEQVCTVAVGAAIVGAGAAVVQAVFDPIIDTSMLEIEPAAYIDLNNKAVEIDAEEVETDIVPEQDAAAPASAPADPAPVAPQAEQPAAPESAPAAPTAPVPADPAPASAPADPAPVAPQAEQPKSKNGSNNHANAAK